MALHSRRELDRRQRPESEEGGDCWLLACLLNVPATGWCISGTDLLRHFTCCHTEAEAADQTFYLTQSQYVDTGPISPSADPKTPGARQGSANFEVTGLTRPGKIPPRKRESTPCSSALKADALATWPTRRLRRRERDKKKITGKEGCFILCKIPRQTTRLPKKKSVYQDFWLCHTNK